MDINKNINECSSLCLQISHERIHFLKFILEGYDGLAVLSTLDRQQGLVELRFPPEMENDLSLLLEDLMEKISFEHITQD